MYINTMASGEDENKVDWVCPVAQDIPIKNLDAQKLTKAREQHGVEVELSPDNKTASITQTVVEGMPAPKTPSDKK